MSEQAHTKDWYVAHVVVLDNENKRLRNAVAELNEAMNHTHAPLVPVCFFAAGAFVTYILTEIFK